MPDGSSPKRPTAPAWARSLRVGGVVLPNRLAFAPMSGVSTLPARLIARAAGAGLVFSETLSATALLRGAERRHLHTGSALGEEFLAVQLFGGEPAPLALACERLADRGVAWVDLNLGCPVPKFIRKGAGAALLRDPCRVGRIVAAMRRQFGGVLSVKMRSGWDARSLNAPEMARVAVDAGAELISIHGRSRAQRYRGRADRALIRAVVRAVPEVPVLANGDVTKPADVRAMADQTGAAGVMIGRGAVGNPWLFEGALRLADGDAAGAPSAAERLLALERHVELVARVARSDAERARELRRYAGAYSRGLPGGRHFRARAMQLDDADALVELARRFLRAA